MFLKNMIEEVGQEIVDGIFRDKNLIVRGLTRYQELYDQYSKELEESAVLRNYKKLAKEATP